MAERDIQAAINTNRRLYGLSNFWSPDGNNQNNLAYAKEHLAPELSGKENVLILAYATATPDTTSDATETALRNMGAKSVYAVHRFPGDEAAMIREASVIYIPGGNTYDLVANYESLRNPDRSPVDPRPHASRTKMSDAIRERVADGTPLIGISAGLLVMFEDIRGSDDVTSAVIAMPDGSINVPITGLRLLPDHLRTRPHYYSLSEAYNPEELRELKKDARMAELLESFSAHDMPSDLRHLLDMDATNPNRTIIALRDQTYFVTLGNQMTLHGEKGAVLFKKENGQHTEQQIEPKTDLSYLLKS